MLLLTDRIIACIAKKHRNLCWTERIFDAQHKRNTETAITISRDESYRETATAHQTLCKIIRTKSETRCNSSHPLPCLRAQLSLPIECFGNSPDSHPSLTCNIMNGDN